MTAKIAKMRALLEPQHSIDPTIVGSTDGQTLAVRFGFAGGLGFYFFFDQLQVGKGVDLHVCPF